MSIALRRPDNARARPSSLLKSDEQYTKVFNPNFDLQLFLNAANIMRRVDEFLVKQNMSRKDVANLRFYVAMLVSIKLSGMPQPRPAKLAELDLQKLDEPMLLSSLLEATSTYERLGATDRTAKGPDLNRELQSKESALYVAKKKTAANARVKRKD